MTFLSVVQFYSKVVYHYGLDFYAIPKKITILARTLNGGDMVICRLYLSCCAKF
uniref:Uncharacterized protein n=1 Tax=Arundo donax TaxID=35708 RepID=A0A0A9AVQ0_ARUDO